MKTAIRRMGNSKGVIIPKPILAQVGLTDSADLRVENGAVVLRPVTAPRRVGWAEASERIAQAGDDESVWPAFEQAADADWTW